MKKIISYTILAGLLVLAGFLIYVGFYCWRISAAAYQPPEIVEFTGALAPNERLTKAENERDGFLYLATLKGDWIARVKL